MVGTSGTLAPAGGSKEIDNIVSQLREVNLSTYKRIENEWARALSAVPPLKVEVNIKVIYEGTDLRPSAFEIKYKIDGKAIEPVRISNIK
ncbi:DNA/RNA non-specific endonuclease [Flavobacterium sp. P7388]|uniref:DNA/RNA non-specific endonuclease n=1 Tax=Flavobacterium geliluteum TaxID=2816120 RepID=A0A940X6H1_9FLAO|nr:DNA/RNA non-specific endonuclease [Flavobacterium geliluteum]